MRKFNSSLLLLNVLLAYNCFSQPNLPKYVADSLWAVWSDKTQADTNRLDALYKYTWDGFLFSQPDSAFYYAELEYNYAKKKGLKKEMADALNMQGISFAIRSNNTKAIEYYTKSLKMYNEAYQSTRQVEVKKGIASSLGNIGNVYSIQGDYANAITPFSSK